MQRIEITRPINPMSVSRQALLNFYWFSTNVLWTTILLILMPLQIQSVVGDSAKGMKLGLVLGLGATISLISGPIFGALSDRIRLPGGRRKPWIVIGTLGMLPCLWVMSTAMRAGDPSSLPGWLVAFMALELFSNIAAAPAAALIPDQVSMAQRGSAAGWLGLMSMLGIFAGGAMGALITPFGVAAVYNLVIVVMLLGMLVVVFGVREKSVPVVERPFILREFLGDLSRPFRHANFRWAFLSRLSISMGTFFVQEFILFYMADAFGGVYTLPGLGQVAANPQDAVSIFLPTLFLGGIATGLVAGMLSDRYGRKPIAYAAGMVLGVTCMIFTFSHSFAFSILLGIIFGLGYGAYESLSWALAADTLPSAHSHGKDMSLWHIAVVLPQAVATPIGGFLLDQLQVTGVAHNVPQMGYIIDFSIAVVFFIVGATFIRQIKGIS